MTDHNSVDQTPPPASPYGGAPVVQEAQPSKAKAVGGAIVKRIIGFAIAAAVIGVGSYVWNVVTGDITTAKVGDCITESVKADGSDAKVVECTDAKAANKVIGIIEGVTDSQFTIKQQDLCEAYPAWEMVLWYGKEGGSGDAWCLEPIKK
jgi:hypothetical protein